MLILLPLRYLFGCAFAKRRHLTTKGQRLALPSLALRAAADGALGGEPDGDGAINSAAVGQMRLTIFWY